MRDSLGLRYEQGKLWVLDQTLLPREEQWLMVNTPDEMIEIIQRLAVRGAPLIGVAAALALAQYARREKDKEKIIEIARNLRQARPTAVNLAHAIDRMLKHLAIQGCEGLEREALAIFDEDVQLCERMAERGAAFIKDGDGIITHCNAGGLATVGIGTALGVIRKAHDQGKKIHVYVDETRPLLQGARITTWEMKKFGIPFTLICDNMAGALLRTGKVQAAFVGADRIAKNGDAANKIGTYGLAVLCHHHSIPFYVVAPRTTFDPQCRDGSQIPIEERNGAELRERAPHDAPVWNPAFDVTPRELITKVIFDDGVV